VLVLVLVAGGVGAAFVLADDDDDGGSTAGTTTTEAKQAQLDEGGTELEALVAAGRNLTFHAVYAAGGGLEVEVWRREGKARQDTRIEGEGGSSQTVGIVAGGETIVCAESSGAWQCSTRDSIDRDIDGLFGSVLDLSAGASVAVTDETVADRPSRCFAVAESAICLTPEGIPTRLTIGDRALELTSLDDQVDDEVFTPPTEEPGSGG
jgi:hypothetical protein